MGTTKGSFYTGAPTIFTDSNPAGPADAPMSSPDTPSAGSFYKETGGRYAAIDLADTSVADVEANAAAALVSQQAALVSQTDATTSQDAASAFSAFARQAYGASKRLVDTASTYVAQAAAFSMRAATSARKATVSAQSAEMSRGAIPAFIVQAAMYNKRTRSAADAAAAAASQSMGGALLAQSNYHKTQLALAALTDGQIALKAQVFN